MTYTVSNTYGIAGESNHKTAERALQARDTRQGDGWIVTDSDGNRWDTNGNQAVIVDHG